MTKCLTNAVISVIIVIQQKLIIKNKQDHLGRKEAKMTTLTVGSQFTTSKSKVSGTIQEIVKNKNGSARVRLDVNGQPRWTTVK